MGARSLSVSMCVCRPFRVAQGPGTHYNNHKSDEAASASRVNRSEPPSLMDTCSELFVAFANLTVMPV